MALPNVVIGGAPKCGTSTLFRWLADHPDVAASEVKETFYLLDAGHPLLRGRPSYHEEGLEGYSRYFRAAEARPNAKVVLEGTTHYLYQRTALDVLSELEPRPHLIFVLRKPSERVYSSYQFTRNNNGNLRRDISFAEFIRRVRDGSLESAPDIARPPSSYVLARDLEYSRYVEHLRPWAERLGRDRVHLVLLEQLRTGPGAVMERLCAVLGLDPAFYSDYSFPRENESYEVKNQAVHRNVRGLSRLLPANGIKRALKGLYLRTQTQSPTAKADEDQSVLAELDREFAPDNARLAAEWDLDLSSWN